MRDSTSENTSATLLGRLHQQPADSTAWQEFVRRHRPRIYAFCLAWPLQAIEALGILRATASRH